MTLKLDSVYVRGSDGEFHLHAKASQEKKSATHYDLLIRKTPEELAEYICKVQYREGDVCPPTHNCAVDKACVKCWLDWLNAEANEM